jgi:plasmid stabilization system protein ParE
MRYSLEYLPIAEKDIRGIALYIACELSAPVAAANLIGEIRKKANNLRDMPHISREYHGDPRNETLYRVMPVKNYLVFYTVCDESNTVEIHRVLYARMDLDALLRQ